MITTYNDEVRKITKGVYVCYLRNRNLNQNQNQQKENNKELMFLVKNLDYSEEAGRVVVLEVLD